MAQRDDMLALVTFAGKRRHIFKSLSTIFLLILIGCATTSPAPITIIHEKTPSQSHAAAPNRQFNEEPAGQGSGELTDLSRRESVNGAHKAVSPAEQSMSRDAGAKTSVPASDAVVELLALLESKKIITTEEAARLTKQYGARTAPEKEIVIVPKPDENERIEKITAGITKEVVKGLPKDDMVGSSGAIEKEQIEQITAIVTREVMKRLPEQIKKQIQEELPRDIAQKEQVEELEQDVSHVTQKVADLYSGKAAELAAAAPEWTKRVRFGGDIRLRYENDRYDDNNALFAQPSNPNQLMDTRVNQDLYKYRARLGVAADVFDELEAVVRVSTGNTSNPVSTNSNMGDFMNKDNIVFDLAYLRWHPSPSFTMYGGRMPNPWFSSDLVWDRDLNFEGLALNVKKPVTESVTSFLTLGAFPLQQYDFSTQSKWLLAGQAGLESNNRSGVGYKIGAAYYSFQNMAGVKNNPDHPGANDWTAPLYQQKGNTLFNISADPSTIKTAYASDFSELSLTGTLDIGFWDPYHIVLSGDYVKNFGFDKTDVARRTGIKNPLEETEGYQIGLSVGHPTTQEAGQWKAYLNYKRLEMDAVVDAFTDSDFHLGGTNARGWILGADFSLKKNTWFSLRWLTADEISGPPLAIDVLQVDFNARF